MAEKPADILSIDEAWRRIRENLPRRRPETVALAAALDRVLATEVRAPEPAPRYTNSAMDGYAVRWEDVEPASRGTPVRLKVIGESQAGIPFRGKVGPGQAVRINTGAMLPEGTDTVIPVEETQEDAGSVIILSADRKGRHIRMAGEDIAAGEVLFGHGTALGPNHIATLAALGVRQVEVYVRPRVSILVTGTELVTPEEQPKPWQIRDSNGIMLELLSRKLNAEVTLRRTIGDDPEATGRAIGEAAENSDILVLTGGVSVGAHDHVKDGAQAAGFRPVFWRVWQKPGKPLFFATRQDVLLFGLPGNPVSAFVCALYYVAPVLRWIGGRSFEHERASAVLTESTTNRSERPAFLQGKATEGTDGRWQVTPSPKQGSHILSSIAFGNCLFLVPAKSELPAGTEVEVIFYPWR